jgi:hypothetical protein
MNLKESKFSTNMFPAVNLSTSARHFQPFYYGVALLQIDHRVAGT